jgi:hypothetical protein
MKFAKTLLAGALLVALGSAQAKVGPDEAKLLGTRLTRVGAEMSGNADGTIPAYTGGLTTPPAGFKAGTSIRPDPFVAEKPRVSINASNMGKYDALLTAGTRALLKKYPKYHIDVYPTHRSVSLPERVLDNTAANAANASTTDGGLGINGAIGGYPFPIPKSGYEAMWNHLLRYVGVASNFKYDNWNVDSSGTPALATSGKLFVEYPYYDPKNTKPAAELDTYFRTKIFYNAPARRAGEALMAVDVVNPLKRPRRAWLYLPGQRRVKLAPDIAYDTPNPGTAGSATYDDAWLFNGAMDRYDFKLVGKKEMLVPYNTYRLTYAKKASEGDHAELHQPGPGALGTAPRVGGRGDAEAGQAPHLRQAHLLPRRGQLDRAGRRHVRRQGRPVPRLLRAHVAELRQRRRRTRKRRCSMT